MKTQPGAKRATALATAARRRVLFEPAGQIIFGLEIEQRLAQRFQLRRNYCELGKASFGQSSLPEEIAQLNEA
jgi:hypothetical protein